MMDWTTSDVVPWPPISAVCNCKIEKKQSDKFQKLAVKLGKKKLFCYKVIAKTQNDQMLNFASVQVS